MLIILPFSERIDGLHFATTRSGFWMQLFLANFWVNPIHRGCSVFIPRKKHQLLLISQECTHRTIRHSCQGPSWFTLLVSDWCSSRSHGFCSTVILQKFSKELLLYRSRNHNGVLKLLSNFLLGLLEIVGLGSMSLRGMIWWEKPQSNRFVSVF